MDHTACNILKAEIILDFTFAGEGGCCKDFTEARCIKYTYTQYQYIYISRLLDQAMDSTGRLPIFMRSRFSRLQKVKGLLHDQVAKFPRGKCTVSTYEVKPIVIGRQRLMYVINGMVPKRRLG